MRPGRVRKRVEDGGDEDRAPRVRLEHGLVAPRVRARRSPPRSAVPCPVAYPNCWASSASGVALSRACPGVADLVLHDPGRVKCWNIATMSAMASWKAQTSGLVGRGSGRTRWIRAVRHLVRDDVVRQAGEDRLARAGSARVVAVARSK